LAKLIKENSKAYKGEPTMQIGMKFKRCLLNEIDFIGIDVYFPYDKTNCARELELQTPINKKL
jgi:hypothetical protein